MEENAEATVSWRERFEDLAGDPRLRVQILVVAALSIVVFVAALVAANLTGSAEPPKPPVKPDRPRVKVELPPKVAGPGEVCWEAREVVAAQAAACAGNGRVYAVTFSGQAYAMDAEKGTLLWKLPLMEGVIAPPVLDGAALYAVSRTGRVAALDVDLPSVLWTLPCNVDCEAGLALSGDRLILATMSGDVRCLSAKDSRQLWNFESGAAIRGTPMIDGDGVVAANEAGGVFRLRLDDGSPAWKFDAKSPIDAAPASMGGRAIVGTRGGDVISIADGREVERWSVGAAVTAAPAIADGRILVPAKRALVCVGSWRVETEEEIQSSPCVSGDRAYFGSHDTKVRAIDLATGNVVWEFKTGWYATGSPIVYRGRVMFGHVNEPLRAVMTDRADGPDWPQFGGGAERGGYNRGRRE